ncbi:MAG: hypothetical protein AAGB00_00835 [Planctomycetota bacterium]
MPTDEPSVDDPREVAPLADAPLGTPNAGAPAGSPASPDAWVDKVEVADPVTLSGLLADLLIAAPPRAGRPWTRYALGLIVTALLSTGFHMVLAYRFGAFFHKYKLLPLSLLAEKFIFHWYHCVIPPSVKIGPGLWAPHPLGIVLNSRARLGSGVYLRQGAEVVHIWDEDVGRSGIVGDRVQLNSGCILIKHGVVGHDAVVAARAVVTKPVPPGHLAVGMPAKVSPLPPDKIGDRQPRWV